MVSFFFFFFKQKTAYEMRISDWSSDVCSSDLHASVSAGSNGSDIIGLLRCESQETWRRWSEGTAYRSDSFSITPTTGIRARKPAPEIGMHRDQRLPFERTFRERYIEEIGIARLLDADPDADEQKANDSISSGDEQGKNGIDGKRVVGGRDG